ncbi:MAG: branched-chain amino acid ABC transporter permease [Burkholderiales bacterium]|jgi:branched-chain amino acid transport system permease protein|nr:branched-chain amino acid ABC transporter permease [Burkholderiales bacterium]MCA3156391.1 branched-chain amino acid ABC transporter permease [Burkholderiales bacterium]
MEWWIINGVNALSFALVLFLLCAGLVVSYSLLGVPNFAHGAFYLLGGYMGYSLSAYGFLTALILAPLLTGLLGYIVEAGLLRRLRQPESHLTEMLLTFGLAMILVEVLQWIWGRAPLDNYTPPSWSDSHWEIAGARLSAYRLFVIAIACTLLLGLWWAAQRSALGLILRAALSQTRMVECLGYRLDRIRAWVFAAAAALAGLAGVLGGNLFLLEPAAAPGMVALCFVVLVLGGAGSLKGAWLGALAVAVLHTFTAASSWQLAGISISRFAALLPYVAMILLLVWRSYRLTAGRSP